MKNNQYFVFTENDRQHKKTNYGFENYSVSSAIVHTYKKTLEMDKIFKLINTLYHRLLVQRGQ